MKNVEYISASAGSGKTYTLTHKLADAVRGFSVDKDGNKHTVNTY
jgi:ATP-dependent exoDNAse (exonuclease V) beta subunit